MSKALYISTQVPTYSSAAGNKTAMDNLKNLAKKFTVDVVLICTKSHDIKTEEYTEVNINNINIYRLSSFEKFFNSLRNILIAPPKFGMKLCSRAYFAIQNLTLTEKYEIVFFEFGESVVYLDAISNKSSIEISLPDILTQWHLRQPWYFGLFAGSVFKYELKQYSKADLIYAQSPKDCELVKSLFGHKNVGLINPHISGFLKNIKRETESIERYSLLFWGAMNRSENSKGILWFIKNFWPDVLMIFPSAKLYIVGMNPGPDITSLNSNNIIVTGYVDDPSRYFELAHVGIAPLLQGAGVKVKVVEMLKAGIPVVSTQVGAEGIELSSDLLIADENNFSKLLIEVLRS